MRKFNSNRELYHSGVLEAPPKLTWEVFAIPAHIKNWWGPDGHTIEMKQMEFRAGGEWRFTMTGPEGTRFPNRSTFAEIIPFKKIVMEHYNPHFITTINLSQVKEHTAFNWSMLFDSDGEFETIVKTFKADEGLNQTINKFEKYLAELQKK